MVEKKDVLAVLSGIRDPELGRDIVSLGFVKGITIDGDSVAIDLTLTTPACPLRENFIKEIRSSVEGGLGVKLDLRMSADVPKGAAAHKEGLSGVKNIVAIASGKGGVGKSTVALMTAFALTKLGARVGILDGDIYNASIPQMLGDAGSVEVKDNIIQPAEVAGIKLISISQFTAEEGAVVWRGPLVSKAIRDFLGSVNWGDLDYLLIDLPPGTGDAPLTAAQDAPLTGVVIISTPQWAALSVALKAADMFRRLKVNIIGIVENMSYMICPHCGERIDLYGAGLVEGKAKELGIDYLGALPMYPDIRKLEDLGFTNAKELKLADPFIDVAKRIAARVSVIDISEMASGYGEKAGPGPDNKK